MPWFVMRRCLTQTVLGAMALSLADQPSSANEPVMIYAAATLKYALDAVIETASASQHVQVTPVYGPSPALVQQLQNGAPGDV
jgi:molybdate transport system substrate-binding protein